MRRTLVLAMSATLALSGLIAAQPGRSWKVNRAVSEIMALLPAMQCEPPEVWQVGGNIEGATRFLLGKLQERGWSLVDYGATENSYALILDPNPEDPNALAIGGLLFEEEEESSTAFLTTCEVTMWTDEGDIYTALPTRYLASR